MSELELSNLFKEFEVGNKEGWKSQLLRELKDKPYESLIWNSIEGFSAEPMYFPETESADGPASGLRNFALNANPAFDARHWINFHKVNVLDVEKANKEALDALENGADGLLFELDGLLPNLHQLLKGILPQFCSISFCGKFETLEFAKQYSQWLVENDYPANDIEGFFDFDPIMLVMQGETKSFNEDEISELIQWFEGYPKFRPLSVRSQVYLDTGANIPQQLAWAGLHLVSYLDLLLKANISPQIALESIQIQLGMSNQYFPEIAKFRAAKHLFAKIAEAYGIKNQNIPLHATSSLWSKSLFDPYNNLIRNTTEAMSAILGGVDSIYVSPYNESFADPDSSAKRIARNVSTILKEEAYFSKVADPVAGSYFVENLTEQFIQKAWAEFLKLEQDGSILQHFESGKLFDEISAERKLKMDAIASRKTSIVGTNTYAEANEMAAINTLDLPLKGPYLQASRASFEFEQLRIEVQEAESKNKEIGIFSVAQGFMTQARIGFTQSYFATIGLSCSDMQANQKVIVLCGSDEDYGEKLIPQIIALKNEGKILVLAGNPANKIALQEAGVDVFIHMKSNIIENCKKVWAALKNG
jgi:methylmalonyl-CoA mutase